MEAGITQPAHTFQRPDFLAELQAMGWQTPSTCRPSEPVPAQGAHQTSPASAAATQNGATKHQQFDLPKTTGDQPRQPGGREGAGGYNRRAAANLINRLRANPSRLQGHPNLEKMVFDDAKKPELITLLTEQNGSLGGVSAVLVLQEEKGRVQMSRKQALRYTKKQMMDTYGEEADKVMKHKEDAGLVEKDENNPDGFVYLIANKVDENEDYLRSGRFVLFSKGVLPKAHVIVALICCPCVFIYREALCWRAGKCTWTRTT